MTMWLRIYSVMFTSVDLSGVHVCGVGVSLLHSIILNVI